MAMTIAISIRVKPLRLRFSGCGSVASEVIAGGRFISLLRCKNTGYLFTEEPLLPLPHALYRIKLISCPALAVGDRFQQPVGGQHSRIETQLPAAALPP